MQTMEFSGDYYNGAGAGNAIGVVHLWGEERWGLVRVIGFLDLECSYSYISIVVGNP